MVSIRRRSGAVLAAAAAIAALAACAPQEPEAPSVSTLQMNVFPYMIAGNWNPVTSTYLNTYFQPQQGPYETLIRLNPTTYEWEPLLAEEFEIGDDQRTMRIRLREDVDFSDGTLFDAEAAKTSFDAALSGSHQTFAGYFGVEMKVTGEYELEVTSTAAMGSDFLYQFGIVPIASPTALEEDPTGLETTPVGTGPYLLDEQVPEVSVRFVRNPDYRDPGAFPFDEIEFLVFDDPIAASNALKSGQINAANLDLSLVEDVESNGFATHLGAGQNYVIVWADPQGEVVPQLTDVRVRQAIAYSLDRESIAETIEYGFATPLTQVWGEGSPYYVDGADDTYAFDVERARELMAEAGYEDGFALVIPSHSTVARYEPVLAQALADIGITVTYETYADRTERDAAVAAGEYGLSVQAVSDLFLSADIRRLGDQAIPELADLYEIVDNGTPEESADAQGEIGQIVLDDALVIALSRLSVVWATVPEITVAAVIVYWPVPLQNFQLAE